MNSHILEGPFALPPSLEALRAHRQFIVCQFVPSATRPGKTEKFPIDWRTGRKHDAHDPAIWLSCEEAATYAALFGDDFGVGFVFNAADPFWFIDVDNCVAGTSWSPIALELLSRFQGAAVEVSHSLSGLHIIGTGTAPTPRKVKYKNLFDLYTEGRFVALTGTSALGDAATYHDAALADLVALYLTPDPVAADSDGWTDGPCAGWNGPTDDTVLIEHALRSSSAASAFGTRASFRDLWEADEVVLAKMYPPDQKDTGPYDESKADSALAQHLAFWTGKDCERILRLMPQSALARQKYDRPGYLEKTIRRVVARQTGVLKDGEKVQIANCRNNIAEYPPPLTARELVAGNFPEPSYLIPKMILQRHVNLLYGDGGVGKTTLALNMMVALASGRPYLAKQETQPMPVLFVCAEDGYGATRARALAICAHLGCELDSLDMKFWCLQGYDVTLMRVTENGEVAPKPFLDRLKTILHDYRGAFVVLDSLADIAEYDESGRLATNAVFKRGLGSLCDEYEVTLLVLGHPSKASVADGTGYSGSTAHHNAVRSRSVLKKPSPGSPRRTLIIAKTSYGQEEEIELWMAGPVFMLADSAGRAEREIVERDAVLGEAFDLLKKGISIIQTHGTGRKPKDIAQSLRERRGLNVDKACVRKHLNWAEDEGYLTYAKGGNQKRGQKAGYNIGPKSWVPQSQGAPL